MVGAVVEQGLGSGTIGGAAWVRGPSPRWAIKVFAIFATAVMVLVVFNIPVKSTTSGGGGGNPFEEQTRRLTVAEEPNEWALLFEFGLGLFVTAGSAIDMLTEEP